MTTPPSATFYPLATVVYACKPIGSVNHLIVPGVGTGWHTLCGRLWANGLHTNEGEWGHRAPERNRPLCKPCDKASRPSGNAQQDSPLPICATCNAYADLPSTRGCPGSHPPADARG